RGRGTPRGKSGSGKNLLQRPRRTTLGLGHLYLLGATWHCLQRRLQKGQRLRKGLRRCSITVDVKRSIFQARRASRYLDTCWYFAACFGLIERVLGDNPFKDFFRFCSRFGTCPKNI
ncbi:unnamed protein product, partial [Heterosigma akashiwo]